MIYVAVSLAGLFGFLAGLFFRVKSRRCPSCGSTTTPLQHS